MAAARNSTNWYAMLKKAAIEMAKPPVPGAKPWVGQAAAHHGSAAEGMRHGADLGRLRAADPGRERALTTDAGGAGRIATKDAGPPVPVLTPAQLAALTGGRRRHAACPTAIPKR